MNEAIVLKGTKEGINIVLTSEGSFSGLIEILRDKLIKMRSFFGKSENKLIITGRVLSETERLEIEKTILSIISGEATIDYKVDVYQEAPIFNDTKEGYTKFYEGTVRSGRLIESKGNLVIVGDVNPGAEIAATGNIIIMGTARGIIHAGCTGNRNAYVVALNLSPMQLRIADVVTRSPDGETRKVIVPEKAYLREDTIYIDEYLTKI